MGRCFFWPVNLEKLYSFFITKDSFLVISRTETSHLHLCSWLLGFPESGAWLVVLAYAEKHKRAGKWKDCQKTQDKSPNCAIVDKSTWLSIHAGLFLFLIKHLGNSTFGMMIAKVQNSQKDTFQEFKICILSTPQSAGTTAHPSVRKIMLI